MEYAEVMPRAFEPIPEPQWAKISDLKAGDTVELHGFDCAQGTVTLEKDMWGYLFFPCASGKHFIDGQLDNNGYLVGITIRPSAQIIPITTQERTPMNLDANDANAVSSFFQSLADKVVLASTLPKEVEELRALVEQLKKDVESYREHMARTDEEISNLRRERQALQDENAALRRDLEIEQKEHTVAESRWSQACQERDRWHNDFIQLADANETAKRERDDAQLKIMELEDQFKRLLTDRDRVQMDFERVTSQLNSIRSALS
jgi:archaellum component FlaC